VPDRLAHVAGRRRGAVLGSMIGAYILMLVVNILLVNVSAYYSTVAEGSILILAVLGAAIGRDTNLARALRHASAVATRRAGMLPRQRDPTPRRLRLAARERVPAQTTQPSWPVRHAEALRFTVPAYVCFAIAVAATASRSLDCRSSGWS
jgi:ribose transport system permease protein